MVQGLGAPRLSRVERRLQRLELARQGGKLFLALIQLLAQTITKSLPRGFEPLFE